MSEGRPPAPRTPQDKKALSYARDTRNAYGENSKASRRLIPLRKAQESRQDRRKAAQALAALPRLDDARADLVESSVRHDVDRVGGWRKGADLPLGEMLERRRRRSGGPSGPDSEPGG